MPKKDQPANSPEARKGYGNKPLWVWILLYVVVGIVLYGLIYFIFLSGNSYTY